jgi:CubicO group peptidase (beta-lactamase class C family)
VSVTQRRLSGLWIGAWIAFAPCATYGASVDVSRMERAIDQRVSTGQFMGSVLVARNDKVLIDKGYGFADLAAKTPNGPDTKFRLGSVTKQFTATCIMLLEERGKLKVEDPVKKYLPNAPAAWDGITIFNLLTHTSGIPNFTEFPAYLKTESVPVTPEQLVARFRDKPLDFAPGTSWKYSNSGYALLGYLIERISGMSYARFVRDNIFVPLGMKNSGYDSSAQKIPEHATGYVPTPEGPLIARYIDMTVPYAAGALYSTTEDLLRWEQGLYGGKLLKPASLQKMTTPFKNHYAFGLHVETDSRGGKVISHNGGIEGFNAHVDYVITDNLAVIVLANLNGDAADQMAADLRHVAEGEAVTLLSDRTAAELPDATLDRLAGHYVADDGALLTISREGQHLVVAQVGETKRKWYPHDRNNFFSRTEEDLQVAFEENLRGQIAGMVITRSALQVAATRISDAEARQRSDALAEKVRNHTPTPGSEAAVRRSLEDIAAGTPDYDHFRPTLRQATRQQLPRLQPWLHRIGALRSIEFKKVGPTGADIYNVTFEHGVVEVQISLVSPGGKIQGELIQPVQ